MVGAEPFAHWLGSASSDFAATHGFLLSEVLSDTSIAQSNSKCKLFQARSFLAAFSDHFLETDIEAEIKRLE